MLGGGAMGGGTLTGNGIGNLTTFFFFFFFFDLVAVGLTTI